MPRADVHHGHGAAARLGGAEARVAAGHSVGRGAPQAFAVTEPTAGSDTTRIETAAVRDGNGYRIDGQKLWTSRAGHSDLMLLLARTAPVDEAGPRRRGLSAFLVDMRDAPPEALSIRPIRTMINHATTEVFFDNLHIPGGALIGEEGEGFGYILDGMNAERILIASESLGDARYFIDKACAYARERTVFGAPIGRNQGVQFPLARAHAQTEAAEAVTRKAAALFDAGLPCGPEANMAKMLASEAAWAAGEACMQTHGGFAFAEEYDIERKWRESRLYRIAPVSTNLILGYIGQHVLGLPRSY